MSIGLRIGSVSAAAGVSRDAVRYYEHCGLLRAPARSESGYRLFTQHDVDRIRDVKQAQALGLTLNQIRGLLAPLEDGAVRCPSSPRFVDSKFTSDRRPRQTARHIAQFTTRAPRPLQAPTPQIGGCKLFALAHEQTHEEDPGERGLKIEILFFKGCPNHEAAVSLVKDISERSHVEPEIEEIEIKDFDTAIALGFLGSPTVRVNGLDVEPKARLSKEFGLVCRVYASGDRKVGVPPEDVIRQALEEATRNMVIKRA